MKKWLVVSLICILNSCNFNLQREPKPYKPILRYVQNGRVPSRATELIILTNGDTLWSQGRRKIFKGGIPEKVTGKYIRILLASDTTITDLKQRDVYFQTYVKDGQFTNCFKIYYHTGIVFSRGYFIDGKYHGKVIKYYPNGSIKSFEYYCYGKFLHAVRYDSLGTKTDSVFIEKMSDSCKFYYNCDGDFFYSP
jgi:hypothetical protein